MNIIKTKRIVISSGFLIVICLTVAIWFQQLQSSTANAQSQSLLTLELSTSQRKYLQLEPIPFVLKLSNRADSPVILGGNLRISESINFLVRGQDNSQVKWVGRNYAGESWGSVDSINIQPYKYKEAEDLIWENLSEELFPSPGRYQMRVEFNYLYLDASTGQRQNAVIVSNPIIIDIEEPKGNDRKAYNYLKNTYEPVRRGNDVEKQIQVRQYFADNFRDSVYWKYRTYDLANTYSYLGKYEDSEREFFKIVDIEFYHSKEARKRLREVGRKLGKSYSNLKEPPSDRLPPVLREVPMPDFGPEPPPGPLPVLIRLANSNPNPTPTP